MNVCLTYSWVAIIYFYSFILRDYIHSQLWQCFIMIGWYLETFCKAN